jgi:DMSO reductase anchor subunit
MKQRKPWLYYLMVWVSGGLFLFFWPFLMARDVNHSSKDYVPRLGVLCAVYGATLTLYLGLVVYEMNRVATYTANAGQPFQTTPGSYIVLLLLLAVLLFALPAYLVAKTSSFIRARGKQVLGGFGSVALFLCYGISLPMIQSKLNELWKAQPNTAVNADAKLPPK